MRRAWIGLAVAGGSLSFAGILTLADPPKDPKVKFKAFKPVQDVEHLMAGQGKLYGDIKDAIIDESWADAETMAWLLAELANVNHFQSTDPRYQKIADSMSTGCVALAKAVRKRDKKMSKDALTTVGNRCKACHDTFQ